MAHHEERKKERDHLPCGRLGSRYSVNLLGQYDAGREDTSNREDLLIVSGLFGAF